MAGLFSSPEEVAQEQQSSQEQAARQFGGLGVEGGGMYLGMRAGQQVGGLLSGPNPAVVRSLLVQNALKDAADLEPGSDAQYAKIAKNLQGAGLFGDSQALLSYAAQQGSTKAKTELEKAQAEHFRQQSEKDRKLMSLLSGASPSGAQPEQLSGPGYDGSLPAGAAGATGVNARDPEWWKTIGVAFQRPEFVTHGERLEKVQKEAATLKQAQDPETGLFSTLFDDPIVGPTARKAQKTLTDNKMDLNRAQMLYNSLSTKATTIAAAQAARSGSDISVIPPSIAHLHGDDYLATLSPGMANVVRAIGTYQATPTQIASMRSGNREAMFQRVLQAYPDFKGTEYPARQKLVNDFTSGPESQKIVQLNQAIAHMGTLDRLGEDIRNGNSRDLNALINNIANRTGNPNINNYDLASQAVAEELMRVFRQVSASEREAADFERKLKSNLAPGQIRGAVQTGVELLNGRIQALNNKWNSGMGATGGFPNILSPEAKQVLTRLGVGAGNSLVYKGYSFPSQKALDAFKGAGG